MLGRGIIGTAVIVYAVVLGCVLWPDRATGERASASEPPPQVNGHAGAAVGKGVLPFRGAAMQLQRVDWSEEYKKSIDEIAAIGLDTVSFVVDTRQENGTSNRIYLDMRMTPSPEMLGGLIDHAKSKGLRVVLRMFRYVGTEQDDPMSTQTGPLGTYTAWVVGRRGDAYVARRFFWDPRHE